MNAKQFELKKREEFETELAQVMMWYKIGEADCKSGVYDKYYRYHSNKANEAYDAGWTNANSKIKNDKVTFIEVSLI